VDSTAEQDDLHDELGRAVLVRLSQKSLQSILYLRKSEVGAGRLDHLVPSRQGFPAQRFGWVEHGTGDENEAVFIILFAELIFWWLDCSIHPRGPVRRNRERLLRKVLRWGRRRMNLGGWWSVAPPSSFC
jgi:hypothetical protein